jgi:hypothetical protein
MSWDTRYQKEMLRRLDKRLQELGLLQNREIIRMIGDDIESTIVDYSYLVLDEKTRPHLRLTACVLASYQTLSSEKIDEDLVLGILEDVFVSIGRTTLKLYTQAMLTFSKDPFLTITSVGKRRAIEQYGEAWEFKFEEAENLFVMTTTKCFYHDFFVSTGTEQLTRIFCSWDENWITQIEPTRHGFHFERPTTLGYGGTECPFIFKRLVTSTR